MVEEIVERESDTGSVEKPQIDPARAKLVKRWQETVRKDKEHWSDDFKRMDVCEQLAAEGAEKEWIDGNLYVVPITGRHINQAVATLYARHPKAVAKPKKKLYYTVWDGDPATLQAAYPAALQGDANAAAIVQEVMAVKQQILLMKRMGKTMEILFDHFLSEQDAGYRESIKAMVRRAKVTSVGYVKLKYQRELGTDPEIERQLDDITSKITHIEALLQRAADEPFDPESADIEDLRQQVQDLNTRLEIIVREGPVLSFPRSKEIIPDRRCRHLKTFGGCRHIAHEFHLTPEEVMQVYGVDLKKGMFKSHSPVDEKTKAVEKNKTVACVWEIQDKATRQVMTICDGYDDFLKPPGAPDVEIDGFWSVFPLVFNEAEGRVYPVSDVWATRHMQREYNNARQGLRDHRIANQPKYFVAQGALPDSDKGKLASAASHELIELQGLGIGEKIGDKVQAFQHSPIDPALYETESVFADVQRSVGSQEANFGGVSGATATETAIAENSRVSTTADNVDDLDTMLTAVARAMGQIMLLELDVATVKEIAGPGAVWPDLNRQEVARELLLEIEAGSSGRPNKAAEMANLERAMPFVLQIPGLNPMPFAKKYASLLDIDAEDAIVEGLPSMVALNQAAPQMTAKDPQAAPDAQAGAGAGNAPAARQEEPGAQPAFPDSGAAQPAV